MELKKFKVESSHKKGLFYDVWPEKPFCSCPEFKFRLIRTRTPCKHILAVKEYLDKNKPEKTENPVDDKILAFVKEKGEVGSLELIDKFGEETINEFIENGHLIEERGKVRLL